MSDESTQKDLKALFPGVEVPVGAEVIKVMPIRFGMLAHTAALVRPIADALIAAQILVITRDEGAKTSTVKLDKDFIPKMFQILDEGAEPLMLLIAYAVGKPRAWLDTIEIDDGIELTQKIWEQNSNFFVSRVLPRLGVTLSQFVSTGATSSLGSSATATEEPTSTITP